MRLLPLPEAGGRAPVVGRATVAAGTGLARGRGVAARSVLRLVERAGLRAAVGRAARRWGALPGLVRVVLARCAGKRFTADEARRLAERAALLPERTPLALRRTVDRAADEALLALAIPIGAFV